MEEISVQIEQIGYNSNYPRQQSQTRQMGPHNSTMVQQEIKEILSQYQVLQEILPQSLTYLQHKKSGKQYLLRELTYNDKSEFNQAVQTVKKKKLQLQGSEHVAPMVKYMTKSQDQFCSTFHKIYALFEYPLRTLDDQISERNLQKRRFLEKELWSILASCILGLSHLQKQGIKHSCLRSSNILLSQQGIIKIADPYTTGSLTNHETLLNKRSTPHIYLSPEQADQIQKQMITTSCNPYKADIWSLGMIMLEAGLLQYQDECYRDDGSRIHWETLNYNINRFGQNYSQQLRYMVEFMLSKDQRIRPEWVQLEEHVRKVDEGVRGSQVGEESQRVSKRNITEKSSQIYQPGVVQSGRQVPRLIKPYAHGSNVGNVKPGVNFSTGEGHVVRNLNPGNRGSNIRDHRTQSQQNSQSQYSPINASIPSLQSHNPIPTSMPNSSSFHPVKISNIEHSRPTRNIFPSSTYIQHTRIDQNLIVVEDEQNATTEMEISQNKAGFVYNQVIPNGQIYKNPQTVPRQFQGMSPNLNLAGGQNIAIKNSFQTGSSPDSSSHSQLRANPNSRSRPNSHHHTNQSEYKVQTFKMGSKYEGFKLNGMRHGQGKFYYQDGGMYDGEWNCNRMQGQGKLYYQSGKLAYEGQWIRDQFTGHGILYNQQPEELVRPFNYKNMEDIDQYWTKYQGNFFEDNKHGKGTLYLSNGEVFQGQFKNDNAHGQGLYHTMNGNVISGGWKDNRFIP